MKRASALLASVWALAVCLGCSPKVETPVRLVVVVVVDQGLRNLTDPKFPGGFGRLAREGYVFQRTMLAHARTDTCAGHAALMTGRQPGPAGIPGNYFVERKNGKFHYCVNDDDPASVVIGGKSGRSPNFLRVNTLGDWMKQRWKSARVYSVSGKDRAAIMMAGHAADGVYWLDWKEALRFTTSGHYHDELPDWLVAFNGEHPSVDGFLARAPRLWEHSPGPAPGFPRVDDYHAEDGRYSRTTPHPVRGEDLRESVESFYRSPFVDIGTLELVGTLIEAQEVGQGSVPDLLAISLSGTDNVGHLYGPLSQEMRDTLRRLDLALGDFLAWLEERFGKERLLVVMTSDHGVLPLPDWNYELANTPCFLPNARVKITPLVERLDAVLDAKFGAADQPWLLGAKSFDLTVNRALAKERGVSVKAIASFAKAHLSQQPGVERVWLADEIARAERVPWEGRAIEMSRGEKLHGHLYRNSYDAERSGDLVIQPQSGCLFSDKSVGTNHGSPYLYDRAVPLVFWGGGVEAGANFDATSTVDVAPTLAAELGLALPPDLDGRALEIPKPIGLPQ